MATTKHRITSTPDCFVGNILQFCRPLGEEIVGIPKSGDLHNREFLILYINRTLERIDRALRCPDCWESAQGKKGMEVRSIPLPGRRTSKS